ncbi:DegT/DnrJ/EryC1/StrS family aminotransferase [Geomesophilobacter sediminis]|uniref:DegT/DnrJ/EryC1/StrS family aminotransferase n=1 Tax=Geomesophilobacter sediminis TaxID=2798584 RepID=A0A8J7LVU7_9BACT|nr:DegT/DnrJ/EryC1/StrS family aminotransferase [Geomesophilobacter sediminis]MBJ6725350.1 DegT/DnrJ/EryC1/StrS family aminotransferase [Geomesophilobacter sediminis]
MKVPYLDLAAQYQGIAEEISAAMTQVIASCSFSGGPFVSGFETAFADFCGTRHAVGVGSGTEALWLSLLALGIGPGDEVITVPNTFIATAEAISLCGAVPVFVDVQEKSFTMDPSLLEAAITPRTRAVIPVHLFGQPADLDPIVEIARRHGLFVVEDACQAHGSRYKGKGPGAMSEIACFSFYPGKNLGAYGEAGGVVTNDRSLAEKVRILRDHGQATKYCHDVIGINSRMDGIQAAVLSVKLKYLDGWNQARIRHAERYRELLADLEDVILPRRMEYAHHVYHIFALRVRNRPQFLATLAEAGVSCGIHYPVPVHLQLAYRGLGHARGSYPVAERQAEEFLSLPMYPELTDEQIRQVAQGVRSACRPKRVYVTYRFAGEVPVAAHNRARIKEGPEGPGTQRR